MSRREMLLAGKVSIITGGSMGIGRAIAKAFLDEGSHCVLAARGEGALATTVEEMAGIGPKVRAVSAAQPCPEAQSAMPTLEDVYLSTVAQRQGALV